MSACQLRTLTEIPKGATIDYEKHIDGHTDHNI